MPSLSSVFPTEHNRKALHVVWDLGLRHVWRVRGAEWEQQWYHLFNWWQIKCTSHWHPSQPCPTSLHAQGLWLASGQTHRTNTHTLDTFSVPPDRAGRPGRSLWSCALWTFFRSKFWTIIRQSSPFLTTRECLKSGLTSETKNPKNHYNANIHRHDVTYIRSFIDVPCQDVAEWSRYLDLAPSSFPDSPCT